MKKALIVVAVLAALVLTLSGCVVSAAGRETGRFSNVSARNGLHLITDRKTGCQYLGYANGGMVQLTNADGTPYVVEVGE